MKRRAVLAALGLFAVSGVARAQAKPKRVVFLHLGSEVGFGLYVRAFKEALAALGLVEGRDITLEVRWLNDRMDRLPAAAAEVVAFKPDVIVTQTSAGVAALRKATSSIPIVFAAAADVVEQGLVASLKRPEGNVTGVLIHSGLNDKLIELTRDAFPAARRLALLLHESDPFSRRILEGFEARAPLQLRAAGGVGRRC